MVGNAREVVARDVTHVLVALVDRLIAHAVAYRYVGMLVQITEEELQRLALVADGLGGGVFASLDANAGRLERFVGFR